MKFKKFLSLVALGFISIGMASCDGGTSTSEKPEWVDYVNSGLVTLDLDYEGHDFYTDGIGQVTLEYITQCIDGDTVHFNPIVTTTSSDRIKTRFYGVDTPESTGKIQPWGKKAAEFTKEHVWNAAQNGTIVLSSPTTVYEEPQVDSTGSRYVTLVWINETVKNAPKEDLILLNLWLVQEGYSWAKNVTDFPEMAEVFMAAENQAKIYELGINVDDPDFNDGEYREDISLLDLKIEIENGLEDPNYEYQYDGEKIKFTGTVAGFANHTLYIVQYFTEEEGARYEGGEYAGINVYVGMSTIPSKYTVTNTFLQICGTAVYSDTFGFQITDTEGRFPSAVSYSDSDTQILLTAEENVDDDALMAQEFTASELNAVLASDGIAKYRYLNNYVEITDILTVRYVYIASSDEITVYFNETDFNVYVTFMYRGDPNQTNWYWTTSEDWVGKRMMVSGIFTYHDSLSGNRSYQVTPCSNSQLVWVDAEEDAE